MIEVSIFAAFIAGLLTFIAPCTLPLIPAFLGYLSGADGSDNNSGDRFKVVKVAVGFVLGFSTVFILFGAFASLLGAQLFEARGILTKVGGVIVTIIGLLIVFQTNLPFLSNKASGFKLPVNTGSPFTAFITGASFSFGWSPCIGPILGGILTIAATSGNIIDGILLMTVFSLGLGIPFIATGLFYKKAQSIFANISPNFLKWTQVIGGLIFVIFGILLFTNSFGYITVWGEHFFADLYFDSIADYL